MPARVTVGGRLHFGFLNLSLARSRLYGGIGVALAEPRVSVVARRADSVSAGSPDVHTYAERAVELLSVPGVDVEVVESLPPHEGLGSGTQLALSVLAATASAYEKPVKPREQAPELGRGGRSGVGVAAFEHGGFVVDAGHPTDQFTTSRPPDGDWRVPPVMSRLAIPTSWRFVLVRPDVASGRHGEDEEASIRTVVERADQETAEAVADVVTGRLMPAAAAGNLQTFGSAAASLNRLNGSWYADEQGGVYRPPIGEIVDALTDDPAVCGAGQSSWGPTVFGVTDVDRAESAREAAWAALKAAGVDGSVRVVAPNNDGATIERG